MKKSLHKNLLIVSLVVFTACCAAGAAFAAPLRWFGGGGIEGNNALIEPWIRVTVSPETAFGQDEEYVAVFTVEQWAKSGGYGLVLSKVGFLCPSETEAPDPDIMWEYYADGAWKPVSQAEGIELIPVVTVDANIAHLKIRLNPDFFQTPCFSEYLEYSLELTAVLTVVI